MQYEGVAVMKMFDKAKVNVNLLIFLLNKKFYGKWVSSDIVDYIHQWEVSSVFFFFCFSTFVWCLSLDAF